MALYESVFIARQDISATQAEGLAEKYTEIIKTQGGSVAKYENWGLRTLAYRIGKNRKGHYILLNIDAPAAAVQEFERNMRIDEDVIRFLTLRVDEHEEGPSAMMRSRGGRDDRRGGRDDRGGGRDRDDRGGRERDDRGKKPESDDRGKKPESDDRGKKPESDEGGKE